MPSQTTWLIAVQVERVRRDERLLGLKRENQPVVALLLQLQEVAAVDGGRAERLEFRPAGVGVVRFLGQDDHEHLVGFEDRRSVACQRTSARIASGRISSTGMSFGTRGSMAWRLSRDR